MTICPTLFKKQSGFTLSELLVVIAVMSVLATVTLAVVNPLEQMNRSKDAKRKATLNTLAKAMAAYATDNGSFFPTRETWMDQLVTNGSVIKAPVDPVTNTRGCTPGNNNYAQGYCFRSTGNPDTKGVIFVPLESSQVKQYCTSTYGAGNPDAYFEWRSTTEVIGIVCLPPNTVPSAP